MIINVPRSSFKVPVILVRLRWIWIFYKDFRKTSNIKFYENPSSGSPVLACGLTDGQTGMTKLIVAFCNFANVPKNSTFFPRSIFLSSFIKPPLFPYTVSTDWFLVAFAKFRELRHVCLSVCPSIRMEQLGSHRRGFQKVWYRIFSNLIRTSFCRFLKRKKS